MSNNYSTIDEDSDKWANNWYTSIDKMAARSGGTADELIRGIQKKLGKDNTVSADNWIRGLRDDVDNDTRPEITQERVDKIEKSLYKYERDSRYTTFDVIQAIVPDDVNVEDPDEVEKAISGVMFVNKEKWKSNWKSSFGF